jgi:hypothetical protein
MGTDVPLVVTSPLELMRCKAQWHGVGAQHPDMGCHIILDGY